VWGGGEHPPPAFVKRSSSPFRVALKKNVSIKLLRVVRVLKIKHRNEGA
jgi:hypothetical protein